MKISMWILYSELAKKYETLPLIEDGEMDIAGVRLFLDAEDADFSPGYVYIGRSSDFFASMTPEIVLISRKDILFIHHEDFLEIVHDVLAIYDKYRTFAEALRNAGNTDDPFQNMLDIIHEQFQCPMFCGQKDLRIYALTKQYGDDRVYDGWEEVKKYFTMPVTLINAEASRPNMDDYPETIETVAIPVSEREGKRFQYQIRSLIHCQGKVWGHLYIYYYNRQVPVSVLQLARYCADAYGELLDRIASANRAEKHKKYTYLADLLDGKDVDKSCIDNLRWQMSWASGEELRLFRINLPNNAYSETFFDYIFELMDGAAREEIVFPYREEIIVVAKADISGAKALLSAAGRVMAENQYVCGASYPFTQLEHIAYAYFQAGFAIEKHLHDKLTENITLYDDYAYAGVLTYIGRNIEYRAFIAPELVRLYELDKAGGTEYYKTLFWLLMTNYHAAEAAKMLYIHRNTLKYRLDKIVQLMKLDIYDSEIGSYLRFCYALMLGDYPLSAERDRDGAT